MYDEPFRLESSLTDAYKNIESIQLGLIEYKTSIGSKTQRLQKFEARLKENKNNLGVIFRELFVLATRNELIDRLAEDIINKFHAIKIKYSMTNTPDEKLYKAALGCVVKPIIASIVQESRLDKDTKDIQERRGRLLKRMIQIYIYVENKESVTKNNEMCVDEEIDVCSVDGFNSCEPHSFASTQPEDSRTDQNNQVKPMFKFSTEALHILTLLFDALSIHCNALQKNFEFIERIYHVMNIFYVVHLLEEIIADATRMVQLDRKAGINLRTHKESSVVANSLEDYRKTLEAGLQVLSIENPFVLYRYKLRSLFIVLSFLIGSVKERSKDD